VNKFALYLTSQQFATYLYRRARGCLTVRKPLRLHTFSSYERTDVDARRPRRGVCLCAYEVDRRCDWQANIAAILNSYLGPGYLFRWPARPSMWRVSSCLYLRCRRPLLILGISFSNCNPFACLRSRRPCPRAGRIQGSGHASPKLVDPVWPVLTAELTYRVAKNVTPCRIIDKSLVLNLAAAARCRFSPMTTFSFRTHVQFLYQISDGTSDFVLIVDVTIKC